MSPRKRSKPVAEAVEAAAHPPEPPAPEAGPPPAADPATGPTPDTPTAPPEPLADRDWTRFADPNRRHSVRWADGYEIAVQESKIRGTVEIQFGDGRSGDKPLNPETVQFVKDAGLRWNGTNAWVIDLVPERGSVAQKMEARERNKATRLRVEEEVFPAVVALEEQKRGEVPLTEETRARLTAAVRGR